MTWDRHGGKKKESILDPNGKTTSLHLVHTMKHVEQEPFDGLENFFEMKKIAEKISARWKYIRVDLYWEQKSRPKGFLMSLISTIDLSQTCAFLWREHKK